jgi:hypothetical protein
MKFNKQFWSKLLWLLLLFLLIGAIVGGWVALLSWLHVNIRSFNLPSGEMVGRGLLASAMLAWAWGK